MGILAEDMPNMFMVLGPHQPFENVPRSIDNAVDTVMELLQGCEDNGRTYVEATPEACAQWTEHVHKCSEGLLANEVDSWLTGVNTNVQGKSVRNVARYTGSAIDYRKRCKELQAGGWPGLTFI